jgi:hypothetical protein
VNFCVCRLAHELPWLVPVTAPPVEISGAGVEGVVVLLLSASAGGANDIPAAKASTTSFLISRSPVRYYGLGGIMPPHAGFTSVRSNSMVDCAADAVDVTGNNDGQRGLCALTSRLRRSGYGSRHRQTYRRWLFRQSVGLGRVSRSSRGSSPKCLSHSRSRAVKGLPDVHAGQRGHRQR